MLEPSQMNVGIIGAGIGGLASAVRLRAQGHQVTVFEANDYPGGKLHRKKLGAYRFDGGPSLFTMPHFVDELFKLAGKEPNEYFTYTASPEACRYFWEDGHHITAPSDPEAFAKEAERVFNYPAESLIDYFDHVKRIYQHSGKIFLEKSLHEASTWLSVDTLKAFLKITQYDLFKSMHEANRVRIGEPHLVQLFNRFATYNGSNPYKAPGILNVIPWLEHGFGTFFPKGGMEEIALSVYRLAEDMGVVFHFEKKVDRILHDRKRVTGLQVDNETHRFDMVVSNMDIHFVYQHLLTDITRPERILKQERSSSALVFYWGIKDTFDQLGLHNIFFSDRYKEEFEALFNQSDLIDDPTVYIHISSKMHLDDAPTGKENWFVMVNAPHHQEQDWPVIQEKVRKQVLEKLSRILGRSIEPLIEEERIWNPKHIEEDTLSYKGALYGNSSNSQFAAFLRHPNRSKLDGLYFCGGSVHPGGGIPLSLLSAKITADLIQRKHHAHA